MQNKLNLTEIDQEQALNLSKFFLKANKNIFLFGRRGVGKTAIAIEAARDCGYKVNYINLSVIERADLAGYPNLLNNDEVVSFKAPSFLPLLKEGEKPNSIILFDEIDKAPHEITAPLLEILQFGTINGKRINVAGCILTGNLINEGAYSNEISSALLDRGSKYILNFSFEKWLEWAKLNQVHDLILGFLSRDPVLACGDTDNIHYASPSPRGWTLASEALHQAKLYNMDDLETVIGIISGYVGDSAGQLFKIWFQHYKHFEKPILSLLESGDYPLEIDKLSITEVYIFCVSLCLLAKRRILDNKSKKMKYAENVIKFFNKYKIDEEIQVIAMRNSFPFEFITEHKLYENKMFFEKNKALQQNF